MRSVHDRGIAVPWVRTRVVKTVVAHRVIAHQRVSVASLDRWSVEINVVTPICVKKIFVRGEKSEPCEKIKKNPKNFSGIFSFPSG